MILLLEADKEVIHYCLKDNDQMIAQGIGAGREIDLLKEQLRQLHKDHGIKMVGYRVENGTGAINRSVMELTPLLAAHIGGNPCFGPNRDMLIKELFDFCSECFEGCRHFILCDSAFFVDMPEYARTYAFPLEYTESGLVRYGRHGIIHEWAVKKLAAIKGTVPKKVITVYLNDGADVVALKDGKPVMTSQGFSDLDGIMSQTGCGLIDTAIVFQLFSAGYSLENIYQILSQESGFKALTARATLGRDIFYYQLMKTIGAGTAILEGIDSIVFIANDQKEIRDWTSHFSGQMEFLDFPIESYYFVFHKWSFLPQLLSEYAIRLPQRKLLPA